LCEFSRNPTPAEKLPQGCAKRQSWAFNHEAAADALFDDSRLTSVEIDRSAQRAPFASTPLGFRGFPKRTPRGACEAGPHLREAWPDRLLPPRPRARRVHPGAPRPSAGEAKQAPRTRRSPLSAESRSRDEPSTAAATSRSRRVQELKTLQDNVPAFSGKRARQILQEELGKPAEELFQSFDDKPLAAASLGQARRRTKRGRGPSEGTGETRDRGRAGRCIAPR